MEAINGKVYPLWSQFVDRQSEWVGSILEDQGDSMDRGLFGAKPVQTKIKAIELRPNGSDSAMFQVVGDDFTCGCDVGYLGITGGEEGWITLSGYGGHIWRIKNPNKKSNY